MKGIIFNLLEDVVNANFGPDAWDDMIEGAKVSGVYTSLGNHETGDRFLCAVADRITAIVRPADTVARLGGDESAILFNDLGGHDIDHIAARVQQQLSADVEVDGEQFTISASLGLAACAADDVSAEGLLRNADDAMYAAKRDGKSRYARYESGLYEAIVLQKAGRSGLKEARERDEFELVLQQLLSVSDGTPAAERAAAGAVAWCARWRCSPGSSVWNSGSSTSTGPTSSKP